MIDSKALPQNARVGKAVTLACMFGLILLYSITGLMAEQILWTVLLAPCFSLLIFLPGLLRDDSRTYIWLCFIILWHFGVAATNLVLASRSWEDVIQALLSVILFITAMITSRLLQQIRHNASEQQ